MCIHINVIQVTHAHNVESLRWLETRGQTSVTRSTLHFACCRVHHLNTSWSWLSADTCSASWLQLFLLTSVCLHLPVTDTLCVCVCLCVLLCLTCKNVSCNLTNFSSIIEFRCVRITLWNISDKMLDKLIRCLLLSSFWTVSPTGDEMRLFHSLELNGMGSVVWYVCQLTLRHVYMFERVLACLYTVCAWLSLVCFSVSVYQSLYINHTICYLHKGSLSVCVWISVLSTCVFVNVPCSGQMDSRSSACPCVWHRLCMKLAFSRTCVFFSLFLTPMFVLLQDSVPMASPAFLLSLFVSIQVLPQISPEPGHAPRTRLSQPNTHKHSVHLCLHLSSLFAISFSSSLVALKEAKWFQR